MSIEEKKVIYNQAIRIWAANDLSDEEKYDLIFSEKISRNFDFDWYDPDMDYADDVNAFMFALKDHMFYIERISKYL